MPALIVHSGERILPQLSEWPRLVTEAERQLARITHVDTGEPVPANALWAIKTGELVGRNVGRTITGREPRPFAYRGLGQAASFGVGTSVATLYGVPITGPVGWALRLVFFLCFMPTRKRAAMVVGSLVSLPLNRGRYPVLTDHDTLKR